MPPAPTSGLPFQLEQHDPCMISEEKEFCYCPHNPVKAENQWPNPIYLISYTTWKLRLGVSVPASSRKAASASTCLLAHCPFTPVLAWALFFKKSSPHFLAGSGEGVGSPPAWKHSTSPPASHLFSDGAIQHTFLFLRPRNFYQINRCRPAVRAHACNPRTLEVESGGSGVQGWSPYRVSSSPGWATGDPVSAEQKAK